MNKVKVSTGDEKNKNQKKRDSIRHEIRKKRLELAIIKIIMGPTPRQPSLKHIVTLVTFFLLLIILSQAVCLILYIYFCFLIKLFLGVIFGGCYYVYYFKVYHSIDYYIRFLSKVYIINFQQVLVLLLSVPIFLEG